MTFGLYLAQYGVSCKFMNSNIFQPLPVPSTDEIREILVRRVDHQKQAAGIVVGIIEPNGRRVVAYGNLGKGGVVSDLNCQFGPSAQVPGGGMRP
jgi:hypothetical protein